MTRRTRIAIAVYLSTVVLMAVNVNKIETGFMDATGLTYLMPVGTFGSSPTPTLYSFKLFTDASATGTCSGGGSSFAVCVGNGAAWTSPFGSGGGGGGASSSSQLLDLNVVRTSGTVLTLTGNSNVQVGGVVYSITGGATATISAGSAPAGWYIDQNGALTVQSASTIVCAGGCVYVNAAFSTFPPGSKPIWTWNASSGVWAAGVGIDSRAFLSVANVIGGSCLITTYSGSQTILSLDPSCAGTGGGGGGAPFISGLFSGPDVTRTIPGGTHGFTTPALLVTAYDNNTPRNAIGVTWTVDPTSKDVVVTFNPPQSAYYVVINGGGGGGSTATNPFTGGGGTTYFASGVMPCNKFDVSLASGTWTYPGGTTASIAATLQELTIITGLNGDVRYDHTLIQETAQFTSGTVTSAKVSIGRPGGGTDDELYPQTPIMVSSTFFGFDRPQPPVLGSSNTYTIVAAIRTVGGNVSDLTAGTFHYEVCGVK